MSHMRAGEMRDGSSCLGPCQPPEGQADTESWPLALGQSVAAQKMQAEAPLCPLCSLGLADSVISLSLCTVSQAL